MIFAYAGKLVEVFRRRRDIPMLDTGRPVRSELYFLANHPPPVRVADMVAVKPPAEASALSLFKVCGSAVQLSLSLSLST